MPGRDSLAQRKGLPLRHCASSIKKQPDAEEGCGSAPSHFGLTGQAEDGFPLYLKQREAVMFFLNSFLICC